jgi:signal transduction histidine kinase
MRTPLNAMLALLAPLKKYISHPQGLELLEIICSSSQMLRCLVNDMLDLFQMKKGQFKKNEAPQDVRKEITIGAIDIMKI